MTTDSKVGGDEAETGAATRQMIELLEAEIERLKVGLELVRAGKSADRRTLIKRHVGKIDERQDALEKLQSMQREAGAAD